MAHEDLGSRSAFDMSFSTFGRINFWLWELNMANKDFKVDKRKQCLDILFNEVHPWLRKKELREHAQKIQETLEKSYGHYVAYCDNFNNSPRKGKFQPPKQIFKDLDEYERFIRKILDAEGILTKKTDEAIGAMIG